MNEAPREPTEGETDPSSTERPTDRRRRGRPLRFYLGLFGLAIALPALGFSAYLLARYAALEDARQKSDILLATWAISTNIDRGILSDITTLRVLASSPSLDSGKYSEFHGRASVALQGTGAHVILLNPSLDQILNTRTAFGTRLGQTADPESARKALNAREPYVSDIFFDRVAQRPVFNIVLPVLRRGEVRYLLVLTRGVDMLTDRIRQQSVDSRWIVTLTDRNNTVLAHSDPRHEFVLPALLPPSFNLQTRVEGIEMVEGEDGKDIIYAFHRSNLTGWKVFVSTPYSVVRAAFRQSWLLLVGGGLVLLGLTILLALLFGRFMTRPVKDLALGAAAVGQGSTTVAMETPIREVNDVSSALASASIERKTHIEHIELLLRELAHRAKNQLTVIQALAAQTAKTSDNVEEFQHRFQERLEGLTRSIELVQQQNWQGAPLYELTRQQLEPFAKADGSRVRFDGPRLTVSPAAAEHLGLALHELATNAAKYGAWSVPEGVVDFQWRLDNEADPPQFLAYWRETNGPSVTPPDHKGFGYIIVDRMISYALNGTVTMDFESQGFTWKLTCPADRILTD